MEHTESESAIRLHYLFHLAVSGKATRLQRDELMVMMANDANKTIVDALFRGAWNNLDEARTLFTAEESDLILQRLRESHASAERRRWPAFRISLLRGLAAAAVLGCMVGGVYWFQIGKTGRNTTQPGVQTDIAPGRSRAFLTIESGREIALDHAPVGLLLDKKGIRIVKTAENVLTYNVDGAVFPGAGIPEIHTISTPKGGKYIVILPDGSKVWLNAASSLKFPSRFTGDSREITLTGEAYLEVKPLRRGARKIGFAVYSGNQVVEVLGTHFNIKNYPDEAVARTTLLEGSVRVRDPHKTLRLRPGEQCAVIAGGELQLLAHANLEEAVAWKNDIFRFSRTDVPTVMRQVSRWYDVDVRYHGAIPAGHITGYISRNVAVSNVLKMLEQVSDLKFEVVGRTIWVKEELSGQN